MHTHKVVVLSRLNEEATVELVGLVISLSGSDGLESAVNSAGTEEGESQPSPVEGILTTLVICLRFRLIDGFVLRLHVDRVESDLANSVGDGSGDIFFELLFVTIAHESSVLGFGKFLIIVTIIASVVANAIVLLEPIVGV